MVVNCHKGAESTPGPPEEHPGLSFTRRMYVEDKMRIKTGSLRDS